MPHGAVDRALPTAPGWSSQGPAGPVYPPGRRGCGQGCGAWRPLREGSAPVTGPAVPAGRGPRPPPSGGRHRLWAAAPCSRGGLHPRAGLMASTASWFDLLGLEGRGLGLTARSPRLPTTPAESAERGRVPLLARAGALPLAGLPPPSPHLSPSAPRPSALSPYSQVTGHQ